MKIITANLLNRLWTNGIKPIKEKAEANEAVISKLNESLKQESQKVGTLTSLTTTVKTSIVNAINSIVASFNNLGAFNPKTVLSSTGNFVITMPANADFVRKTITFSKNVNQLMPFFIYTDGFYNCKPVVAVAIDGKNVTLTIMGTKTSSSAQSLQLWYIVNTTM